MSVVEIKGWMTEQEQYALRRLAFQKDVLEIGSYEGLSTVNLANTAKSVTAVDPFDARMSGDRPNGTYETFCKNIKEAGVAERVSAFIGTSREVLPGLGTKFDLVFIDGDHSYEAVKEDIALSLKCLRDGGLLAFHDYDQGNMGVVKAVDEIRAKGAFAVSQTEKIVVISPIKPVASPPKEMVVALCMPHRNLDCNFGAAQGFHMASSKITQIRSNFGMSILTQTFNTLLAEALNARETDGVTHFAMLHNDVIPMPGWLDILKDEMYANDLDMISAVVPLKNLKGLTSTGIDTIGDPWCVRRLTMTEVFELPETFTAYDIPYRATMAPLLLNTGCWLMKLDEPWVEGLHFRQIDRIVMAESTGKYVAQSISEDWDFSRQLVTRGARVGATRKVHVQHERPEFHNISPWGEWKTDEVYLKYLKEMEEN